jgi:hypothetical protein
MERSLKNVHELGAGKFDAVRVLRDCLAEAERGDIKHVIVLCADAMDEDDTKDGQHLWATWSFMTREQILWLQRWANSFFNHRYFGQYHDPD